MIALATAAAYDVARLSIGHINTEAIESELKSIELLNRRLQDVQTSADDFSILLLLVFIHADCETLVEVNISETKLRIVANAANYG